MNDELVLKIFHCQGNLSDIVTSLDLSNAFSSLDELIHGLVGA